MPRTFRNPRMIAEEKNRSELFDPTAQVYDGIAGTPPGVAPQGAVSDYAANPVNPTEKPAPSKNLKR